LIDYAIIGKPILNIETGSLDAEIIKQFLQGNYANALQLENVDKYKIENIVHLFLKLV
jgi:hypothetical protein